MRRGLPSVAHPDALAAGSVMNPDRVSVERIDLRYRTQGYVFGQVWAYARIGGQSAPPFVRPAVAAFRAVQEGRALLSTSVSCVVEVQ